MMIKIDKSVRAKHYSPISRAAGAIKYIVVHYTGNSGTTATAYSNANWFRNTDKQVSAHYVVDDGEIVYQCVPDLNGAYAIGDSQKYTNGGASMKGIVTNSNSINIEMVSHSSALGYYIPAKTVGNTIELIRLLQEKYNIPDNNVYRHYDVTGKLCPQPFVNTGMWSEFKEMLKGDDEVVGKTVLLVNGKEVVVERILKNGTNYIRLRDFDEKMGICKVSYDSVKKMPIVNG